MHKVIDTPWNVSTHLPALRAGGVDTVIRYYNRQNSTTLPEKRITAAEAAAIAGAGLSLCVVYQQRGGAEGNISDLDAASGESDAKRALNLADGIEQPNGSAIYFAVDHDYYKSVDLDSITAYFAAAKTEIGERFRIGVYGSGLVGKTVRDAGFADLIWLAAARGWSGTREMLATDAWALYQHWPPIDVPLPHDGNTVSPAWPSFGQFVPGGGEITEETPFPAFPNTVLMEVVARGGLNLRRGPATEYAVERTLPTGTILNALDRRGDWVTADLDGDGLVDGHVHGNYLKTVSGGFPLSVLGFSAPGSLVPATLDGVFSPYDIARAELALDVGEVPGPASNPRIVMYHNTTKAWSGTEDSVAWCSSFVNYCVEQSGRVGTDSQRALDWEDWGQDVGGTPEEGDIVVFERVGKGGHVAFLVEDLDEHVSILGGNQSNRVRISTYPKDGVLGGTHYKLCSIRRS